MFEAPWNVDAPILVTLSGIVMDVKLLAPANADAPICVASVIITSVKVFGK